MAGIVVFLIAIPLCLGIALASGAPYFSGIIAGIIGGIVVGSISASSVSVSGPAAGLIALVFAAITQLGDFQLFLLAVVIAGILQILMGVFRVGLISNYVPSNVVQGLMCAIGILIIIKQLPLALTHPLENRSLMEALKEAEQSFSLNPLLSLGIQINLGAAIISFVSLFILILEDKVDKLKFTAFPATIVVVFLSIFINQMYDFFWPAIKQNSTQLVNIPINDSLNNFFSLFQFPQWSGWLNPNVYFFGISIALVASLETLLNLKAVEKLDKERRYASSNRELIAQGVGNVFSGLLGGLPITSVIVRSSVNIQAGARTKLAAIFHGFFVFIMVAFFPEWLNKIPLAALAAILIYVGYKLSKVAIYKEMYSQGFDRFFPFVVTIIAIVFTNLLAGVLIGLVVSFFFILKSNSQIRLDIIREIHPFGIVRRILLPQQVSFLRKASLIEELNNIPSRSRLVIDATYTAYIDKDILELIKEFKETQAISKKIALNLIGFKQKYDIHDHIDFITVTSYGVQASLTPDEILTILKEGNQRFLNNQLIHRDFLQDIKATSNEQHPIAVVLGCIDSRVPVETIFDMGVGNIFCVRVAGNVISKEIIASIEFACYSGAKLILILGHTECGAIRAATKNDIEINYIAKLLAKIKPAIDFVKEEGKPLTEKEFLLEVAIQNVQNSKNRLVKKSKTIQEYLNGGVIKIVGAIYHVESGEVVFF